MSSEDAALSAIYKAADALLDVNSKLTSEGVDEFSAVLNLFLVSVFLVTLMTERFSLSVHDGQCESWSQMQATRFECVAKVRQQVS